MFRSSVRGNARDLDYRSLIWSGNSEGPLPGTGGIVRYGVRKSLAMTPTRFARRLFLKAAAAPAALALIPRSFAQQPTQQPTPRPQIALSVRDFGATGDGVTKDTVAIQQALDRCAVLGGGEVLVPAGNYLTGAIALRSNTTLRLEKDAGILGTPDFADYPVTQVRWEGKWIQGHTGLIYAIGASNIGVMGPGKIVGNPALGGRPNAQNPLRHPALIEPIA